MVTKGKKRVRESIVRLRQTLLLLLSARKTKNLQPEPSAFSFSESLLTRRDVGVTSRNCRPPSTGPLTAHGGRGAPPVPTRDEPRGRRKVSSRRRAAAPAYDRVGGCAGCAGVPAGAPPMRPAPSAAAVGGAHPPLGQRNSPLGWYAVPPSHASPPPSLPRGPLLCFLGVGRRGGPGRRRPVTRPASPHHPPTPLCRKEI